jgi:hypothetical protein
MHFADDDHGMSFFGGGEQNEMDIRTEADLQRLIGESESMSLEFKGPEDFLSWPQSKQNVTKTLSE